ncbi:hypothetical protein GCM10009837_06590 [Streptomyces durmitorensis]|uniref:Phage antirepressor KilAC domain-containing protein n=1 Tax=Streptomyces durmitorensis TaxID=319947 RepID=A0ABY4PNK3_9ACTN|nr:BRO family protein [Streptomyces durmitorensis]UQT54444.1 phage antirepressor KilAC domain-containing protein [Streptomyces durmitorensis]
MTTPLVFTFPETAQHVRSVMIDAKPWWLATDVCAVLSISNVGNALSRVDEADKSSIRIADGTPGNPNKAIVNESGLYDLVLDSRKPEARAFRRWITDEVVPSLRQTGSYSVEPAAPALPQDYEEALVALLGQVRETKALTAKVAELEPAATSWNVLASTEGDFAVGDAAKILSRDPQIMLGRNRLFTVLADYRWTYRQVSDNRVRAMQTAIETGRLSEIPMSHYHPRSGELVLDAPQLRVTTKGLHELHKRLGGTAAVQIPSVPVQGGTS